MKIISCSVLLVPLLAGCLSSAPKAPVNWTIDFSRSANAAATREKAACGAVRIASVDVRSPYSGQRLVVLRPDGSIAFDAFNVFAESPSMLLKGAVYDAVEASGKFGQVLVSGSVAKETYVIEVVVTQLALDCRTEGRQTAKAALTLTLLQGRTVVASIHGTGVEEAGTDYSAAFSKAFGRAMQEALGKLPVK